MHAILAYALLHDTTRADTRNPSLSRCMAAGGVLTAWYVIDNWGYLSMWPIMVFFNLLPGLVEAAALCTTRRSRM